MSDWSAVSGWWWLAMGIAVIAIALALWIFEPGRTLRAIRVDKRILAGGTPHTATILAVRDTGTRVSLDDHVLDLKLHVSAPSERDTFDTTVRAAISPLLFADFAEGRQIRVKIDPRTRRVAIDQRTRGTQE